MNQYKERLINDDRVDAPKMKTPNTDTSQKRDIKPQAKAVQKQNSGNRVQVYQNTPDEPMTFDLLSSRENLGEYNLADFIKHRVD